jgi:hypothetical protein
MCHVWKKRKCKKGFGGKLERQRSLVRPRRRQEDNIKMNLTEIGWESVDRNNLTYDRDKWRALVTTVKDLWFP